MKNFVPEIIVIDEASVSDRMTENILSHFPDVPYEIIPGEEGTPVVQKPDRETVTRGKRVLFLQRNRGPFIERCPGTREALCCNYFVAHLAVNCHFDCTYCYLQSYLNSQNITVNTNLTDFCAEVEHIARSFPTDEIRIGTGELADSLALDEICGFTTEIVPLFSRFDNVLLELKTKGDYIENLLSLDPKGRTMVAWSLNPQTLIDAQEHKTASLIERLDAARRCAAAGYKLAFHFDPIILHNGWESNYRDVVEMLFDYVDPDDVFMISLGVLRFTPAGKAAIQRRFPKTEIIYGEMVAGNDGKLRYIQPVRTEVFRKMRSWIQSRRPDLFVYLCMEGPAVYRRVYGADNPIMSDIRRF